MEAGRLRHYLSAGGFTAIDINTILSDDRRGVLSAVANAAYKDGIKVAVERLLRKIFSFREKYPPPPTTEYIEKPQNKPMEQPQNKPKETPEKNCLCDGEDLVSWYSGKIIQECFSGKDDPEGGNF